MKNPYKDISVRCINNISIMSSGLKFGTKRNRSCLFFHGLSLFYLSTFLKMTTSPVLTGQLNDTVRYACAFTLTTDTSAYK